MGVWIETEARTLKYEDIKSHPVWVCGLKRDYKAKTTRGDVTPCMGVWIETVVREPHQYEFYVTPCMGVWIETGIGLLIHLRSGSHTLYGCVD